MIGIIVGIIVGLLICLVVFRFFNNDGKMKTQYDEMQELIRGRGYKYAFYTMLVCEGLLIPLSIGNVRLPFDAASTHFLIIFIGVVVHFTYSIFNDAYIGLNTNMKRFVIVMVIVAVINFASAFAAFKSGDLFVDGQFREPFVNFLCGMLFVVLAIELFIKRIIDSGREEN